MTLVGLNAIKLIYFLVLQTTATCRVVDTRKCTADGKLLLRWRIQWSQNKERNTENKPSKNKL